MSAEVRVALLEVLDRDTRRWWTSADLALVIDLSASAVRENLRILRIRGAVTRRKFGNRYEYRRRS